MSGGQHGSLAQVWLRCPVCDRRSLAWHRDPIPEEGRAKRMYCPTCRRVTPHVEIRDR